MRVTPTLSVALTVAGAMPDTVAPDVGVTIVTVGGVVSTCPVLIVAVTADVVVVLPALSVALAVKE